MAENIPFGLQLYSVRHACEKEQGKAFPAVAAEVAKMGYDGVEFAGYYGWGAADLKRILDDNGLVCCGAHVGLQTLLGDELEKSVEFHKTIGNRFLVVPGLAEEHRNSLAAWQRTADLFNEIAERLRPHDMYTGYHNHSVEFQPMESQLPWDVLFGRTNRDVIMQLDLGNAMEGGGEPLAMMERYPGRTRTLHMKEFGGAPEAVIGQGEVDWRKVMTMAPQIGGTEWYIVEHERDANRAVADAAKCLSFLRDLQASL